MNLNHSRLVRYLAERGLADANTAPAPIAHRLGQMIDLNESISLSSVHAKLGSGYFEESGIPADTITRDFVKARGAIIETVVKRLTPGATRVSIPQPAPDGVQFEPYRKFYAAAQRDIDFKVRSLHAWLRESVAGQSRRLAKVAALDAALNKLIAGFGPGALSGTPGLFEARFEALLAQHDHQTTDAWFDELRQELQELLLAEVELRLLPILGLIEALEEETKHE